MAKYIIQKATALEGQAAAFRKAHTLEDLGYTHIGQRKYDGCHMVVAVEPRDTPRAQALSRTQERVRSCDHIIEAVLRAFGPGWVTFGEAWVPGQAFAPTSGMFRQHTPAPDIKYVVYDAVPYAAFERGEHPVPYRERLRFIMHTLAHKPRHLIEVLSYNPGTYGNPVALANRLCVEERIRSGDHYDGLILRDPAAPWFRGEAKAGELVKVKPVLALDLPVTASYAEHRDTKLGGYLTVAYKGVTSDVGSGLTQHMLQEIMTHVDRYVGQIAEVECMGITPDGKLREPRFKGWRFDKLKPD